MKKIYLFALLFLLIIFIYGCNDEKEILEEFFFEDMIDVNTNIKSYKYNFSSSLNVYRSHSENADFVNEYNKKAFINRENLEKYVFRNWLYIGITEEMEDFSNQYFKNGYVYIYSRNKWIKITFEEYNQTIRRIETYGDDIKSIMVLIEYDGFKEIKNKDEYIILYFDVDSEKLFNYTFRYNEFYKEAPYRFVYFYNYTSINLDNIFKDKYLTLKINQSTMYIEEINIKFIMLYSKETTNNQFLGNDAKIKYNLNFHISDINENLEIILPEEVENADLHTFDVRR